MDEHGRAQKAHYEKQYAEQVISRDYDKDCDLWEWVKWYPLLVLEKFLPTITGKSVIAICCGAGRELGLFSKHGLNVTATDLTIEHLHALVAEGVVEVAEQQNAERLTYPDDYFDYGFVNAGLHHLEHPHAGLSELLRTAREAVIFIESQDSVLHTITRAFGRHAPDFEPAGNYVYRWKKREIEKIALSAHAHSFAVKTTFLPVLLFMRGIRGRRKNAWQQAFELANTVLAPVGNLLITIIFKRQPTDSQVRYLEKYSYSYSVLEHRYPASVSRSV